MKKNAKNKFLSSFNNKNRLVNLIEQQVGFYSNKIAIFYEETSIDYLTLNQLANQLAFYIKKIAPKPGQKIVIYLDRNSSLIISILAILKSDNIYIPIDVRTPSATFSEIINDLTPSLILSTSNSYSNIRNLIGNSSIKIVNIDEVQDAVKRMPKKNLDLDLCCQTAYILYTSGTTGKPKGVEIAHKSLENLIFAMKKEIYFNKNDVLLAISPITFDISVPDIYLPLSVGASFILANTNTRFNPNEIIYSIARFNVTVMQATPTTWQMLVENGWKNELGIRIICGGEALTTNLAKKLRAITKDIWNFYGPTETTVWSTYYKIEIVDESRPVIAIGKPIANTQIYVLNEKLQQQPTNNSGELYIGGLGVSIGYLNRPELNEKYFISNPFSENKKEILYKTGDLVVQDDEGNLHYLGRIDTQIKIRGHRIEASAIENAMVNYQGIKDCVVLDKNPDHKNELVAYLILDNDEISLKSLQEYLKAHFPKYMVPTRYVIVDNFPVTANGKIDRKNIHNITQFRYLYSEKGSSQLQNKYEEILMDLIQSFLQRDDIDPESNFFDLGLHSLLLVNITQALNRTLNQPISVVDLFEHPTVRDFANFLLKTHHIDYTKQEQSVLEQQVLLNLRPSKTDDNHIAVIGLACKVPGADNYKEFWELILQGKETIQFFNKEELKESGVLPQLYQRSEYVAARGILCDIDKFDAGFFNYAPSEARIMDPQHRIFLEQSWSAIEDAGYVASQFPGKIGVYAGMNDSTYLNHHLLQNFQIRTDYDTQQLLLATSTHYLATKVAYALGLTGPSVTVNTACSTGLVAIAMACNSLINHDTDMALAGAITIVTPQKSGYLYQDLGILSPDGHCRVFDEHSQGTVLSNGCGIVILRRLSDALKDNDNILGVIKGWALNNDGLNKVGFTAPSIAGQVKCIKEAITRAEISPTEVEYVETHGTGTLMGDPIEISSLSKAYEYDIHQKNQYCALGSVKANIGHTDSAAGAIGFIKTILALYHKIVPPQINYSKSNANINFKHSPYYVNREQHTWDTEHKKRTAAVHSLGFGGTNAHAILQEAPRIKTTHSKLANLLIFSAKNERSLYGMAKSLHECVLNMLKDNLSSLHLADMAYTLQMGRQSFKWRVAIPYQTHEHLINILNTPELLKKYISKPIEKKLKRVIFGFVGQGSQYAGMAAGIYQEHPYFRQIIDECCIQLQPDLGMDLREILFPKTEEETKSANEKLRQTQYTQPSLFIIEYALAKLLMAFGVQPDAMIGHSIGEYVAATISGVLSLNDAIKLIAQRSQLMASTESGIMLVVPLSIAAIRPYLNDRVELAAHNAPNLCVVAGTSEDIVQFRENIRSLLPDGLDCKTLHTSHAFHSHFMEPIQDKFYEMSLQYTFSEPKIPYISNVTGDWINSEDLGNKRYWAKHLRQTVMFSKGLEALALSDEDVFIEIGPGRVLTQLIRQHSFLSQPVLLSSLPSPNEVSCHSYEYFLNTIGQLWLHHHVIDWMHLYTNEIRQRCAAPTYVFDRQSYWVNPDVVDCDKPRQLLQNNDQQMFYKPVWERDKRSSTLVAIERNSAKRCLIIFCDEKEKIDTLSKNLHQGRNVYLISSGSKFHTLNNQFIINLQEKEDYLKCLKSIQNKYDEYEVLHAWLFSEFIDHKDILLKGPYSLLYLTQAFNVVCIDKPLKILVVTNQIYNVMGNEDLSPEKATILGPCKVVPQEQNNIAFKLIDLENKTDLKTSLFNIFDWELANISHNDFKQEIAYRGNYRWIRKLKPCEEEIHLNQNNRIRKQGVYVITGGLGGIGLSIAEFMAKNYNANLILVTRNEFPSENTWQAYIDNEDNKQSRSYAKIKKLLEIQKHAHSLRVENAAIENIEQLNHVLESTKKIFNQIHGVIHAAGVAGGGLAQLKTIETYEDVLKPKLMGTANLIKCLQNDALDIFVLISSITSITGFPGQIDYCSANCVLDSYANKNNNFKHSVFCVGMNWLAWREVGMAAESKTLLIELDEKNSISAQEGCRFFEKIVNSELNQVVITKEDLDFYETPHIYLSNNEDGNLLHHSTIVEGLLHLWKQILGIEHIDIDDDFYELGGHSLLAVSLLSKIRHQFDVKIPSTTLFEVKTIRGLATLIESYNQENETYSPLVVLCHGDTSKVPLFMIHPVGGTVFCYIQLANLLQTDRTIYAFQDPSIEAEKSLFANIEEMATFYLDHIRKIQEHGPYYLCGASFGSLVVTEIAYRLEQQNEKVRFIGIIDGWGKHGQEDFDIDYVRKIIHFHHPEHHKNSDLDKQFLWESLLHKRLNMMLDYTYKNIQSEIILFKARDLLPEYKIIEAPDNHWSQYAFCLSTMTIPGDHNTMMQEPYVATLAAEMSKYLG